MANELLDKIPDWVKSLWHMENELRSAARNSLFLRKDDAAAHLAEARRRGCSQDDLKTTVGRGMSGEVAQGAADRMKREVEQVKPDLVIWQVGTNDALRHVAIDSFKNCMKKTLAWLKEQQIDVVLINPQYGNALIKDAYYEEVVAAIADVAQQSQVLLVDRFGAMRKLQRESGHHVYLSADNLHMNDEGYRRLAEQLAATIVKALRHTQPKSW